MEYMFGFFIASMFWIMALNPMNWSTTAPLAILLMMIGVAVMIYEFYIKR